MARVIAGVDTHKDPHDAAVISLNGEHLSPVQFPTTKTGYQALRAFITCQEELLRVGIERTNSYGAKLSRHLRARNIGVVEVIRPAKVVRGVNSKSDAIDAYTPAHTALAHPDLVTPKTSNGTVEAIPIIHAGRRSASKAHAEVITQIKSLLVTAPEKVRAQYRSPSTKNLVDQLAASRPHATADCVETSTRATLKRLVKRYIYLDEKIRSYEGELETLVEQTNTALTAVKGVSTVIAKEVLHLLTNPQPVIPGKDHQTFRLEIGLTLMAAAQLLDCDLNRLSWLERGVTKDQKQALEYQQWLTNYPQLQTLKTVA